MVTPGVGKVQLCTTRNCTCNAYVKTLYFQQKCVSGRVYHLLSSATFFHDCHTQYMHMQVSLIKQQTLP